MNGRGASRRARTERVEVTGVVQGVGFRPFVYRLATELGLDGIVGNDATQVFIEVSGRPPQLDEFTRRLSAEAPPLARVDAIDRTFIDREIPRGFQIVDSAQTVGERTLVPPDTAVCGDCLDELTDPSDRRFRHPFITCTNCGPRFTIICDLPYDRPTTTMADFAMCDSCAQEYANPRDRRYHAQPICCHDCGPRLELSANDGTVGVVDDPLASAVDMLCNARTVAIKGLGGYHLACDATDDEAIARLRQAKHRPDKPFAVMVADLDAAQRLADVAAGEAALLRSPMRPIVLLRARGTELSTHVAPENPLVGVMLPSTPIHHLLFELGAPPLIMTSGNVSGEPLVHRDLDAGKRLSGLCDAMLTHDRPIQVPCDDSVARLAGDRVIPIRRARGFAPLPVPVGEAKRTVLAVGGELKSTFCVASLEHAWMSQHIGDMENLATLEAFERSVTQFTTLYDVQPEVVAVDAHPGYATSKWARREHRERLIEVQHHHAHVAAVMAEHECDPYAAVIGIAFDGTGYGDDGTIWGGEVLVADVNGYDRVAHLSPVPLPGGDAAIRHPSRVALSHLAAAGIDWDDDLPAVSALVPAERTLLTQQLERGVACVPTTSMGRLFDAVASLVGLRHSISYEAQAAIDLEIAAARADEMSGEHESYEFDLRGDTIDQRPVIRSIVHDLRAGCDVSDIANRFHGAVAGAVVGVANRVRAERRIDVVTLSGGVFQNALITQMCTSRLEAAGFDCLTHHLVPPNDGGLALGQAYVAAHRMGIATRRVPGSTTIIDTTSAREN